jgi:hypothetical protein
MWLEVNYNSGRLFTATSAGVTGELARLLMQHGIEDVQTRVYPLVYRAGEVSGRHLYEDMRHSFQVSLPYFQKWIRVPSDYEEIQQQALKDMQQPDFVATWTWVTAWGTSQG